LSTPILSANRVSSKEWLTVQIACQSSLLRRTERIRFRPDFAACGNLVTERSSGTMETSCAALRFHAS
jgi:hypothetical protein